ncbi:MAG: UvrD-helicase domain-containing protein [Clostridia bacterium]|nr:UvrD-helicase domain-containing protein [Clostridia bacterium]
MATYKPTEAQRRAIEERGNLIVSAAAGAGKTTVLTKRIAGIIREGASVDELLILTFTRAAAQEMRQRIEKELKKAVAEETDPVVCARLMEQANAIGSAYISTIDSFCGRVVKRFGHRIGIPPTAKTGDEIALAALKERTKDDFLHDLGAAEDAAYRTLLTAFRAENKVWESVETLDEFLAVRPDPEGWIAKIKAEMNAPDYADRLLEQLVTAARFCLEAGKEELENARKLVTDDWEKVLAVLTEDISNVDSVLCQRDANAFIATLNAIGFSRLTFPGKTPDDEKKPIQTARENYKDAVKKARKYFSNTAEEEQERIAESNAVVMALCDVTERWRAFFGEAKAKAEQYGFSDAEHIALRLLKDPEVAAEYRERFRYIAVDEYQDSNALQEALLDCIRREDNLFLVGDVKQSIYRFRAAEPGLFLEKLSGNWHEGYAGRRIDLNENFRSHSAVLKAVNAVMHAVMTEEVGEMNYDDSVALVPGNPEGEGEGGAELYLINRNPDSTWGADTPPSEEDDREETEEKDEAAEAEEIVENEENACVEARFAAKRIRELMETERYRYGDFAVLLRASTNAVKVAETLALCGVPAFVQASGGFFDAIEVVVLLNLLRVAENRRQDIPLVSVLRSPLFGFTDAELAQVRLYRQKCPFWEAFTALAQAAEAGETLPEEACSAAEKSAQAERYFKKLRFEAELVGVTELVTKVIDETHYYEMVGAQPEGAQRRRNLDALIDQAQAFEAAGGSGLWRFLSAMDSAKNTASCGAAQEGAGDVVRIMTVHKSKGLEFPVVFLLDAAHKFNSDAGKKDVQIHDAFGIGIKYAAGRKKRKSLCYRAVTEKTRLEELSEEMRVLYVALTRAKKRVIVVGTVKDPAAAIEKYSLPITPAKVQRATNALDWVLCGVTAAPDLFVYKPEDRMELIARTAVPETAAEQAGEGSAEHAAELIGRFAWRYPYGDASALPGKQSVSRAAGLRKEKVPEPLRFEAPHFMTERAKEQASLRGTVVHLILKTLPLTAEGEEAVAAHIAGMTEMGVMEEELTDDIRVEDLVWLTRTPLWQRMGCSPLVKREWSFTRRLPACRCMETESEEPVLLQGVIDCCFLENDGWVLIDYKTDRKRGDTAPADYAEKHRPQVELYADALEQLTGKPVKEKIVVLLSWHETVRM